MLPSQKNSFYGYLRALRPMVRGKDERAEELALDALRGLVSCRYPLLKKRLPKRRFIFSSAEQRSIERFVHWIQGQEVLEAAFWLSSLYAALVTEERRHGRALFFTPPELSRRLVSNLTDQGVNFATARFIDPACGGAAFLAPIAIAIRSKLRGRGVQGRRMLKHLERHLTGWDLDPTLRNLSCAFLWMAVYSDIAASGYVPRVAVSTGDSLRRIRRHRREYDVVIC